MVSLTDLENELLERLSNAPDDILSEISLVEGLEKTKQTSTEIEQKVEPPTATRPVSRTSSSLVSSEGAWLYSATHSTPPPAAHRLVDHIRCSLKGVHRLLLPRCDHARRRLLRSRRRRRSLELNKLVILADVTRKTVVHNRSRRLRSLFLYALFECCFHSFIFIQKAIRY